MSLSEKKVLTALKSYLEFERKGETRMVYAVGDGEKGTYSFFFDLPVSGDIVWHINDNFSIRVTDVHMMGENGEIPLSVGRSMDGYELLARAAIPMPTRLTVTCRCEALDAEESMRVLQEEYGNRTAHIEQLLQSERELQESRSALEIHIIVDYIVLKTPRTMIFLIR